MKYLFKKKSTQILFITSIILYLVFYIFVLTLNPLHPSHQTMMSGTYFLFLFQILVLFVVFKHKLLISTISIFMVLILFDIINNIIFLYEDSSFINPFLDIFYNGGYAVLLMITGVGIYLEIIKHERLEQITFASYGLNEAVFIEHIKKTNKLRLEFSNHIQEVHEIPIKTLVVKADDFINYLHPSIRQKYHSFEDFITQHQEDSELKVRIKFPTMKKHIILLLKGSFKLEHRFVCLGFDMTEQDSIEKRLYTETEKLNALAIESQKIIENTGVYISKMAPDGTIVFASESLANLYDLDKDTIVGKNALTLSERYGDFDHRWFADLIEKGSSEGTSIIRTSHKIYHISWKNDSLYDSQGNLEYLITVGSDITDLVVLNQRLEYQSVHDSLTNLLNYRGLIEQLENEKNINRAVSFFIDVRDLSFARDYYGNEIGDFILTKIADEIYELSRSYHAIVSRYYGDQFVMVCFNPTDEELERLLIKLKETMLKVYRVDHANVQIKKSIGYAIYKKHTEDIYQLITLSSLAMKASQMSVHNEIIEYHLEMSEKLNQNIDLAYRLHQAILDSKIQVYFQKIMDVKKEEVSYIEALARWCDEDLGFIRPDVFFNIANESNLIDYLEEYVVHQAIYKFAQLKDQNMFHQTKLTINLTPSSFLRDGFAYLIESYANEYKIETNDIVIEVSENTFVHNLDMCNEFIKAFKDKGFMIAIDDFGSQYSSLAILEKIDYDIIKIDGAFITNLSSEKNVAIIQMIQKIASLSHKLMIAESVETKEISDLLLSFDCQLHQGYYFHKPEKLI